MWKFELFETDVDFVILPYTFSRYVRQRSSVRVCLYDKRAASALMPMLAFAIWLFAVRVATDQQFQFPIHMLALLFIFETRTISAQRAEIHHKSTIDFIFIIRMSIVVCTFYRK